MADLTKSTAVRNSAATYTENNADSEQTIVASNPDEKTCIIVRNADPTHAATIKVKAGTGMHADLGDLEVTVNAGAAKVIGPLDSMRFKDMSSGKITVAAEIEAGGTLSNVKLAVVDLPGNTFRTGET